MFCCSLRHSASRRSGLLPRSRGVVLGALLLVSACGGGSDGGKVTGATTTFPNDDVTSTVTISSFSAEPNTIVEGETALLSWEVSNPSAALKITPVSDVITGTSLTVSPVVTTTYTLTATTLASIAVKTVTVVVTPALGPPTTPVDDGYADDWTNATGNLEGLPSDCGNLSFMSAFQDSDTVIASVALQGMWALSGASPEWQRLGAGGGSSIINRGTSIVRDPANPDTYWQSGVYTGGGVYRTDDNGATFQQLGDITHVALVSVDFTDPQRRTLVAGIHEQPTVYKSTNGGATWQLISETLPDGVGHAGWPLVIDSNTFLVGSQNGDRSGIFRTVDGGATWTTVSTVGISGEPLVVNGAVYWLLEASRGVIKSVDGGITWTRLARGPNSFESRSLLVLPDGRLASIGDRFVIVSDDDGATWRRVGPRMPYTANGLAYSPARNAFFAWRFTCISGEANAVPADAIIRLDPAPPPAVAAP